MQKAFINYKDEVLSFPLVEKHMGIFKSGRYSGFDELATVNDLIITINHSSNVKKTLADNSQITNFGSFITPTGTVVHQESGIDLTIGNNIANPNTRIDFIIAEHEFSEIQGGSQATYSILQGDNNGDEPVLSDDKVQTLLAKISIAPNGSDFPDLTLIEVATPTLGATTAQQAYDYIKDLINSGLPVSTETIKGIIELATEDEATTGTDAERAITPLTLLAVLTIGNYVQDADYNHTDNNLTDALAAMIGIQTDWDQTDSGEPDYLKNKPDVISKVTSGEVTTSNRSQSIDYSANWNFNIATILPPAGKNMTDLLGVVASLAKWQENGFSNHNNRDHLIWCRSRTSNPSFIEVIAQSKDNKINSVISYLAIWK